MEYIYIATYDEIKKGIYTYELTEDGRLNFVSTYETEFIVSYMVRYNNKLYCCFKGGGGFEWFNITPGGLVSIARLRMPGREFTHLAVNEHESYVALADYHLGKTDLLQIEGETVLHLDSIAHTGSGPNRERQTKPYIHFVGFTPDEDYVYACDLGADLIRLYEYRTNSLVELKDKCVATEPGSGPRHGVFSADGRFCYVVTEMGNTVEVYAYESGQFTHLQSVGFKPEAVTIETTGGAIRFNQTGDVLFVSNRFYNCIVPFSVDSHSGLITERQLQEVGDHPRDFNVFHNRWIVVGAMEGNKVEVYGWDELEGIQSKNFELAFAKPVCVV